MIPWVLSASVIASSGSSSSLTVTSVHTHSASSLLLCPEKCYPHVFRPPKNIDMANVAAITTNQTGPDTVHQVAGLAPRHEQKSKTLLRGNVVREGKREHSPSLGPGASALHYTCANSHHVGRSVIPSTFHLLKLPHPDVITTMYRSSLASLGVCKPGRLILPRPARKQKEKR